MPRSRAPAAARSTSPAKGSGSAFTSSFTAAISGFAGDGGTAALSDIIDVTGSGNAGDHVVWTQNGTSGTLQVEDASNNVLESLTLDGSYGQQRFVLTETGSVDAIAYNSSAPCYRRGTRIRTARGDKKVEQFKIGDKVRTASGALRPIKWIGRRSYAGRFVMGRKDILPVCIKSGAIGENVPARDLWVSPNHAMYLSGVLIEAKDLVNGVSIVQAERVEASNMSISSSRRHDVIIAEGALAESFIDDDSRAMFHNAHDYATLYADEFAQPAAIARRGSTKATRSKRCGSAWRYAPAYCARPTRHSSARCAVTSTASVRRALPAGRRTPMRPKRRSASTFSPTAS